MTNLAAIRSAAESFLQSPVEHQHLICIKLDSQGVYSTVGASIISVEENDAECSCSYSVNAVLAELDSCASVSIISKDKVGIVVLLGTNEGWTVVSVVISTILAETIDPSSFAAVTSMCWDGYCKANRALNGEQMARVFHPLCRLIFVGGNGKIVSFSQEQFCSMVTDRYSLDLHKNYAHLQNDPRAAAGDTMLGITFISPQLAVVTLKVGHPPCLWTDLFTVARLSDAAEETKWWIVHKSSTHEKLLAEEALP